MVDVSVDFRKGVDSVTPALRKLQGEVDKLTRANQKLADTSRRGAKATTTGFKEVVAITGTVVAAYAAINRVIRVGNTELENRLRLQNKALTTQITVAQSQRAVIRNLGKATDEEAKDFLQTLRDIRKETGLESVVPINLAAAAVLSATKTDRPRSAAILRQSIPFFRDRPEQAETFGGSIGDILAATGVGEGGLTAEQAVSLAISVQGRARFVDLGGIESVSPVFQTARITRKPGVDLLTNIKQAGALTTAIGSQTAESKGPQAGTAAGAVVASLAALTPETAGDIFSQLEFIRQKPELQKELLSRGGFRAKIRPAIEELVSGTGGAIQKAMIADFAAFSTGSTATKQKQLSSLTPEIKAATAEAARKGRDEDFFAAATQAARIAIVRAELAGALEKSRSRLGRFIELKSFDIDVFAGRDPVKEALRALVPDIRDASGGFTGLLPGNPTVLKFLEESRDTLLRMDSKTPAVRVSSEGDE